jgi:hypothetical protein
MTTNLSDFLNTGYVGFTGSIGTSGFTGSQGDIGFTGSQGGFFSIEAERGASVALDQYFAFGNGGQPTQGVRIPINSTLGYLTISSDTTQTAITVELFVNGLASGQTVSLSSTSSAQSAELAYAITAGDTVTFKCVAGSANATTLVGAWFLHDGVKGYTGSGGIGFTGSKGELGIAGFLADVSNTAPFTTTAGHMWFDTNDASLSVYFNDGDSEQWVVVTGERGLTGYTGSLGFTGSKGDIGFVGSQGPADGFTGSQGFTGSSAPTGIPQSNNSIVTSSDAGKHVNTTANVTIDTSTSFSIGDMVSFYNSSNTAITIVSTGVTLRLAGTPHTGNRTLSQFGLATALCVNADDYAISGAGIS